MDPRVNGPEQAPGITASTQTLRLFVLLACAAPLLLLASVGWLEWEQLKQDAQARGARTATALAEQALRVFDANASALARIDERARGQNEFDLGARPEFTAFLRSITAEVRQAEHVGIIASDGRLAAFSAPTPAAGTSLAGEDAFQAHVGSNVGVHIGKLSRFGRDEKPKFMISRSRTGPDGGFGGVVFSTVSPNALTDFYRSITDPGDSVTLVRADGTVLARYPAAAAASWRLDRSAALMEASRAAPGGGSYRTAAELDPVDRLHVFAPVGGYPVYVSYGVNPAHAARHWWRDIAGYGLASAFSSLLLALVGAAALRRADGERRALGQARAAAEAGARAETELSRAREQEARDAGEASEARLRAIVESVPVGLAFAEAPSGRIVGRNLAFERIVGGPELAAAADGVEPDVTAEQILAQALSAPDVRPVELLHRRGDGRMAWIAVTAAPIREPGGGSGGSVLAVIDIDGERRALEDTRRLVDELNHRVKNTLSAVQSIAHQTLRVTADPVAARLAFESRLLALSAAHDVLTRRNWDSVELPDMLDALAAPHDGVAGRWRGQGPRVQLTPRMALPLALALHELFSNARRHGALSATAGEVHVSWMLRNGAGGAPDLEVEWRERGGPRVDLPKRTGFGLRMLKRNLALELDGVVDVEFAETGLVCRIRAPLRAAPAGRTDVA